MPDHADRAAEDDAAPGPGGRPRRARVRRARPDDIPHLVELAAEHAAFERAAPPAPDLDRRLDALLFGASPPRLRCLVLVRAPRAPHTPHAPGRARADADRPGADWPIVGYASCAPEVSTWAGREYLHMDCLYVRAEHRGAGLGALLVDAVAAEARDLGMTEVQWQTPAWNDGAVRFYARLGAHAQEKLRYSLPVPPTVPPPGAEPGAEAGGRS